MLKIVSFDIGGTLLENEKNCLHNYNLKELTKLTDLPYENVRDTYKEVFQKSKGTLEELINVFCTKLKIEKKENLIKFFTNKFSNEGPRSNISYDNITLINKIKEKGYKVILFSNSCCLLNNDSINEIINLVDGIFYSYDIGYTKDDEESYDYIETKMSVSSEEILHIGDTFKSDYIMPIRNGWKALFYGSCDDENVKSISSLMELYDILGIKNNTLLR